ncbi:pyruvate/2-oxoglutarate dehydrogenase complex, dihydrolipoamide acyltransferase (E2) component [Rhodovulum sulfidophilum]|uniref:Beta-barrel assembly complex subunit BamF n=1 Tax=Rhodovulum visakhapatnamense TaxID=364297 RepID=A0A4R8FQX8_9RHOB|nr:DUF3035 domain-containing protein [Rhodovulum visakhapatnamense]MBL3569559.1 DUF3035 domain-containing protein [Rhodovulum visakhapatnamense]MBL3578215.1 DUF3035 domain-containing protein [Rhodovulum visakhapatnamense]OLS42909.1 pyruvate/2-oxoglutarate dehydrogenase complex, dihydrolipoamide acyltransferase (E2) component [Rhodovulum sulfidophilum]TDX28935.1 beta-barrel assembly complex subunit BamF [Rhodovulum visakhapatnamense]
MRSARILVLGAAMAAALSGCSRGDDYQPKLMHLRGAERGPDEFSVVPNKPLEMPQDVASLPAPTPGGANLVDPTPEADAIAALGGNAARGTGGDPGLMAQVGRFGVDPSIRQTLAQEDLEYRQKHDGRLLERWFNVTVYYKAYSRQALNQYEELERWRARGVRNVSAPPEGLK